MLARMWRKGVTKTKNFFWPPDEAATDGDNENFDRYGKKKTGGELGFLPERTCAICYSDQNPVVGVGTEQELLASTGGGVVGSAATDITNPYEAIPCGDVYCFVCLAQKIEGEEGEGWTCLRCGELVLECKPWNGDVIESKRHAAHHLHSSKMLALPTTPGGTQSKSVGFYDHANQSDSPSSHSQQPPLTPGLSDVTMRELEPIPTEDELSTLEEEESPTMAGAEVLYDVPDSINESAEWARASETLEEDSDDAGSSYDDDEGQSEDEDTETEDEYYNRRGAGGGTRFSRE
jgi:peroxin-2